MLQVFFGNNTIAVRTKAQECARIFETKGMSLSHIDADTFLQGALAEAAGASSLFGEKTVYVLDMPSSDAAFAAEVENLLPELQASAHVFVVIEGPLLAAQKKQFQKYAESSEELSQSKERAFNVFALADSLSRRDKKTLWLGLCEAKAAGLSAEEIIGTLWWQLKTLRLASLTDTAAQADMKDFPYNKAKRSLAHFKDGDLERLSQSLLALYHQGHQGETDIDLALEQWTLTI